MSSTSIYTSGEYLAKHPDWHAGDSAFKAAHILKIVEDNGIRPRFVCDVGCGAGGIVKAMAAKMPGVEFRGYDLSPDAVRLAGDERILCGDFFREDTAYDLVLAIDVFEHVPDYMGFLEALVSRGRWFVFHVPLDISILGLLRGKPMTFRADLGHLHYFWKATALATLRDTGYEVVDSFYTFSAGLNRPHRLRRHALNLVRQTLFAADKDTAALLLGGYSLMVLAKPVNATS